MTDLTAKIDRLAAIKKQQDALKKEKDKIEAEIIIACETDLDSTKYKSVTYSGSSAEVKVVNAESLKLIYNAHAFLPDIFGKAYDAIVTEKKDYTISSTAARMLTAIRKGDYTKATVAEVVGQIGGITDDERKQLLKKCKGKNYEKDVESILKFTSLSKNDALDYAFLIYEAAAWEEFCRLMQLNGVADEEAADEIISKINAAFIVDDSTKLQLTVSDGYD